jgi:PTS system mannose-specific IIA component
VTIGPPDDVEQRPHDTLPATKPDHPAHGVATQTDIFRRTPSNLPISCMGQPNVEVLAGINMPMLVKLAKIRDETPLEEAVTAAQAAGRKYVTIASRVLAGK